MKGPVYKNIIMLSINANEDGYELQRGVSSRVVAPDETCAELILEDIVEDCTTDFDDDFVEKRPLSADIDVELAVPDAKSSPLTKSTAFGLRRFQSTPKDSSSSSLLKSVALKRWRSYNMVEDNIEEDELSFLEPSGSDKGGGDDKETVTR